MGFTKFSQGNLSESAVFKHYTFTYFLSVILAVVGKLIRMAQDDDNNDRID